MKSPKILCTFAALAFSLTASQAVETDPVGFTNLSIPTGTSLVVPTLNNSSVYTGSASISNDGLTITPTTNPSWTVGSFSVTSFTAPTPNYPRFYAEVISGSQEGLVIDINSNNSTSLSILPNEISLGSGIRGATVQVAIRQHLTLDKIISGSTGLSAFQDSVSIYNSDGSQSVCNFDGTSFLDRNFTNSVGHSVVYPGTGFVISVSSPVSLVLVGGVKTTKTQVPLYVGATNIVGPMNPASSTLLKNSSTLASALAAYQDGINNYSTDGQMTATPYASDGSVILDRNFTPLSVGATDSISINRGVVITVSNDTTWTVASPIPSAP